MNTGVELHGGDILKTQLLALPDKVRREIDRTAITEINKIIAAQLKSAVPKDSGALQKSIKAVRRSYKGGDLVMGIAGPEVNFTGYAGTNNKGKRTFKRGKKQDGQNGFKRPSKYIHLVEFGTQNRTTSSGASRGSVTGTHVVEYAQEQIENQVRTIFENAVRTALGNI